MQALFKTLACLLFAAVVTAPLAALDFRPDPATHQRSAGCHEDGGTVPAPQSTSHSCCQGAHQPAILQSSTLQTSFQCSTPADFVPHSVASAAPLSMRSPMIAPGDPPIA